MILGFHCIMGMYGFWLPNEPRGSWSTFVRSWELYRFGDATTVDPTTRRSVAHRPYDHSLKKEMQQQLKHAAVTLTGEQARLIVQGFHQSPYVFYALAVMPTHLHMVIKYDPRHVRRVVGHLKSLATRSLRNAGHYLNQPIWADHGWNVYLNSQDHVLRSMEYVEKNPLKEGLPRQKWIIVKPYQTPESTSAASGGAK